MSQPFPEDLFDSLSRLHLCSPFSTDFGACKKHCYFPLTHLLILNYATDHFLHYQLHIELTEESIYYFLLSLYGQISIYNFCTFVTESVPFLSFFYHWLSWFCFLLFGELKMGVKLNFISWRARLELKRQRIHAWMNFVLHYKIKSMVYSIGFFKFFRRKTKLLNCAFSDACVRIIHIEDGLKICASWIACTFWILWPWSAVIKQYWMIFVDNELSKVNRLSSLWQRS